MTRTSFAAFLAPLAIAAALAAAFPPFPYTPQEGDGHSLDPPTAEKAISSETFTEQWTELESLAGSLDATEYSGLSVRFQPRVAPWSWVVRIRDYGPRLPAGTEQADTAFAEGELLPPGIYRNVSGFEAILELDDGEQLVYGDQALIYVHGLVGEGGGAGGTSVSVTCAAGYYACCNAGPPPTARCYRNTDIHTCDAGGLGAISCTVATP